MDDSGFSQTSDRVKKYIDIAIGLYIITIISFALFGAYSVDLTFKVTLNGLLKPTAVLLFLVTLKIFLSFYEFRFLPYDPKIGAKLLRASIFLVDISLYIYAFAIASYIIFGPISIVAPLVIKVGDYGKPLLVLSLLVIFRFLADGIVSASGGLVSRTIKSAGENRWRITLLLPVLVFAAILRIWNIEQGLAHNIFHTDALPQITATLHYLIGDYAPIDWMPGYPFFSMHLVEYAVIFNIWLQGLITNVRPGVDFVFISLTARWLNVFYGLVMIGLVYKIALYLRLGYAAWLSALMMAVSITQIQMTKALGNDLPMSFFAVCSLFFMVRNVDEEKRSNYIFAGIFAALSFASKYNGLLIIIPLFLLYGYIHPGRDFIKKIGLPLLAAGFFVVAFFLTNPLHWTDPEKQLDSILSRGAKSTNSRSLDPVEAGSKLEAHVKMLSGSFDYHYWTAEGIVAPVPVWLLALAIATSVYFRRWNMIFAWLGFILMFLVAKITKPNAAPYHLLHLAPLAFLVISKSVKDIARMIPFAKVRFYALLAFVVFLCYHPIHDTSFYSPKPLKQVFADWFDGNIVDEQRRKTRLEVWHDPKEELEGRYILKYHHDMPKAYSGVRDLIHYISFSSKVRYLPSAHFATEEKKAFLFPGSSDLVTTMRLFSTKVQIELWALRKTQKERLILRSELDGPILIYVKNDTNKKNRVSGAVGRKPFDVELNPSEFRILTFRNPWPSYLYYGKFVEVNVESEKSASWYVGDTARIKGDIYHAVGNGNEAIKNYFQDGTAYSLMRVIKIADNNADRSKAASQLTKNHSAVIESDASSWESLSGYSDKYFDKKMTQTLLDQTAYNGKTTAAGLLIPERTGVLAGPYMKLMRGFYRATIFVTPDESVTRLQASVTSDMGVHSFVAREVLSDQMNNGILTLDFEVENLFDTNVEVRVHDIEGGAVIVHGATIESLYKKDAAHLIKTARDFIAQQTK